MGVREIQRALHFSSPSSALHHLSKLEDAGILGRNDVGDYLLKKKIRAGILNDFLFIRSRLIPKQIVYASIATLLSITYLVTLQNYLSTPLVILALLPSLVSAGLFWYQAWALFKFKDTFK